VKEGSLRKWTGGRKANMRVYFAYLYENRTMNLVETSKKGRKGMKKNDGGGESN
jgi:hypothetical protein